MRFALVGCGVIGHVHARAIGELSPQARLVVAVGRDPARTREFALRYNAEPSTSIEEALSRDDVDAVAICTPSGHHADVAVAALEAGKHVVVEKPLDVTVAAALRVVDAQRRTGRTVAVISQHRFDPASRVVREAIASGQFGRLTSGQASIPWWRTQEYYDSGEWRGTQDLDGGGALMNQGIHSIDLLTWFMGEPSEVFAWTDCLAHERIAVEDTAVATIRFASGALGIIHGTTSAYPGLKARVQVHGDRGSAIIDGDQLRYFHSADLGKDVAAYGSGGSDNQVDQVLPTGPVAPSEVGALTAGITDDAHVGQFADFVAAVAEGRQPLVTAEEAITALGVIEAIYESARAGAPVRIRDLPSALTASHRQM